MSTTANGVHTQQDRFREAARLQQSGSFAQAEHLYRSILKEHPGHPEVCHNLALILIESERAEAGLALLDAASRKHPDNALVCLTLIDALLHFGHLEQAKAWLLHAEQHALPAAQIAPRRKRFQQLVEGTTAKTATPKEHSELFGLYRQKRYSELEERALKLSRLHPDDAVVWQALGLALRERGEMTSAIDALQQATTCKPDDAEAHNNLGLVLQQQQRLHEAERAYRTALRLNAGLVQAHQNLGAVLRQLGRYGEAEGCIRTALKLNPNFVEAHCNLGDLFAAQGRVPEAEVCFRRALSIRPDFIDAHFMLGKMQMELGSLDRAEECLRQALERSPDHTPSHECLGSVMLARGEVEHAISQYRHALKLQPNRNSARSSLLFAMNYGFDCEPGEILETAREFGQFEALRVTKRFNQWRVQPAPTRLRVGLLGGDFRQHPVGYFLQGILPLLDDQRFELIAYPTINESDLLTEQLKHSVAAWRPLAGMDDDAAATRIHADGVHVLIDLSGHTAHHRLGVFARKPAPVQASWPGYFSTTGVAEIDWFLADPVTVPETHQTHFIERIWPLPHTRLCFTPPLDAPPVSQLPMLKNGHVTFGCFQNLNKLNDHVLNLWGRIMIALPDAKLRVQSGQLKHSGNREHFQRRLVAAGVDMERVRLLPAVSRHEYLMAYSEVDLILDTFPYTGGTTTCEALWMGVPTLTMTDQTLISRQGASMMHAVGLEQWIVEDQQAYLEQACVLARDPENLSTLRTRMRDRLLASPLFDTPGFVREIEQALWVMWQQAEDHCVFEREISYTQSPAEDEQDWGTAQDSAQSAIHASDLPISNADAQIQQLIALLRAEAFETLVDQAHQLIEHQPEMGLAWKMLGLALRKLDRLEEAVEAMRISVEYLPEDVEALGNLGGALAALGQLDEAVHCHLRALELNPDDADSHTNLALVQLEQMKLLEASVSLQAAIDLDPENGDRWLLLGKLQSDLKRKDEAERCFRQALDLDSESAEPHFYLGTLLLNENRLEEAERELLRAHALDDQHTRALANLGVLYHKQDRALEAERWIRKALVIDPKSAQLYQSLAGPLLVQGRHDEAIQALRDALEIEPKALIPRSNLLFSLNYDPTASLATLFKESRVFGDLVSEQVETPYQDWLVDTSPERLRIGLVSGDLRQHPVGYFLEGILPVLDADQIELLAYPTVETEDLLSAQLKSCVSDWTPLHALDDISAAKRIREDRIHVLIDLSGHTAHHRLGVFAYKPAPVQVSWPGYFATTGVSTIDWFIADPVTVPESNHAYFVEGIWKLPHTRLCFTPPLDAPPVAPLPMLTKGHVTFGCFQNLNKVNDKVLALWARIMQAIPDARFRFQSKQLRQSEVVSQFQERLASTGIDPSRVTCLPSSGRLEYLAAHAEVDIVLDTFPYTGGTTTCEALWMGVPTITLNGQTLIARQGASMMQAVGLSNWVFEGETAYVAKAIELAADPQSLALFREGLRARLLTSPLFDTPRFAHDIENALRGMWQQYVSSSSTGVIAS